MTSALDMCHAARRAWERSQPQLTITDVLDDAADGRLIVQHDTTRRGVAGSIPAGATIFAPRAATVQAASGLPTRAASDPGPCLPDPAAADTATTGGGANTFAAGTEPPASPGNPSHGKDAPRVVDGVVPGGGTPAANTNHNGGHGRNSLDGRCAAVAQKGF